MNKKTWEIDHRLMIHWLLNNFNCSNTSKIAFLLSYQKVLFYWPAGLIFIGVHFSKFCGYWFVVLGRQWASVLVGHSISRCVANRPRCEQSRPGLPISVGQSRWFITLTTTNFVSRHNRKKFLQLNSIIQHTKY